MYQYTDFDRAFLRRRTEKFRDQVARRLTGALNEDEFKPLRLMNGLYLMLHAYMLRIAIPYGTLSSHQMRQLAMIADRWDKGYGHFTTRQNIQFNWPKLRDVPDILDALADVDMHAIQSSGACIRNVTADHFAGAAADEVDDPRPTAELIRQWSTDHDEFAFLPRKFKVAVVGSDQDRAVTKMHDVGLKLVRDVNGTKGYEVSVGGGLGRTPMVGRVLREFLPREDLLPYLEAVLQVYNLLGRRDNKYKARIKITVHEMGLTQLRDLVEGNFKNQRALFNGADQVQLHRIEADFQTPDYVVLPMTDFDIERARNPAFLSFIDTNTARHKNPDYAIVTVSLKAHGETPGDASSDQMRLLADLAQTYGHDELRVSHEQNILLPHVHKAHLPAIYHRLKEIGLATANIGLISDMITCPGMDYCDLATARSIPVAQQIARRFDELKLEQDIGPIKLKISGCINACGHHHVGHIGILGLEKAGVESYQITLGGDATEHANIGKPIGPGFAADAIVPAIERLILAYLDLRLEPGETFLAAFQRLGTPPFKTALYGERGRSRAA
jgi:sulfite reductase (NADPH) hemoprotein beta-component